MSKTEKIFFSINFQKHIEMNIDIPPGVCKKNIYDHLKESGLLKKLYEEAEQTPSFELGLTISIDVKHSKFTRRHTENYQTWKGAPVLINKYDLNKIK